MVCESCCQRVCTVAELGVDSAEIRELFLAKIYELCNPSRNMAEMQDDFRCESNHVHEH